MRIDEELKEEMKEIADLVDLFPSSVQAKVFDFLTRREDRASICKDSKFKDIGESGKGEEKDSINEHREVSNLNSFAEFAKKCNEASNAYEKNLLIIYYYEFVADKAPIKDNLIKDKYKKMGWKPNKDFRQGLNDTKTKKGWIYMEEGEDGGWLTSHQGVDHVKDELIKL